MSRITSIGVIVCFERKQLQCIQGDISSSFRTRRTLAMRRSSTIFFPQLLETRVVIASSIYRSEIYPVLIAVYMHGVKTCIRRSEYIIPFNSKIAPMTSLQRVRRTTRPSLVAKPLIHPTNPRKAIPDVPRIRRWKSRLNRVRSVFCQHRHGRGDDDYRFRTCKDGGVCQGWRIFDIGRVGVVCGAGREGRAGAKAQGEIWFHG